MNSENVLAGTAALFLALGDETRLRLLNLMRDREICVSSFTGTLGQSQPLISRHLAYLRNSGLVEARRDGKWMHYSISGKLDTNTNRLMAELFNWMGGQEGLQQDRKRYRETYPTAASENMPQATPRKATGTSRPNRKFKPKGDEPSAARPRPRFEPEYESELEIEITTDEDGGITEADFEAETFETPAPRHNELEDFLL